MIIVKHTYVVEAGEGVHHNSMTLISRSSLSCSRITSWYSLEMYTDGERANRFVDLHKNHAVLFIILLSSLILFLGLLSV